ncbi:MAG: hypothetical protein JW832_06900 [Deltaproteobacteria bacterium]|nr:hypothetical protein [Deltaproteobacteria bacterium]
MNILVCIDDTDNIESRGTGELASLLAQALEKNGWGKTEPVTRHQLFVHPDIAYTSHNSAMCFAADIVPGHLASFTGFAKEFLARESAEGSDPGLCIVTIDALAGRDDLIAFGRRAKQQVLTKQEAYGLAQRLGIHLSEHGGTGLGIIGALAGSGLRMTGSDGRFRGKFYVDTATGIVDVAELKRQTGVAVVKSIGGPVLHEAEKVQLGDKVKAVLLEGRSTLLVTPNTMDAARAPWQTCTKQQLKVY